MTARCSLDDFIEHNKKEVRVDPYSPTVEFSSLDYKVPPGALFDLRVLRGEGYILFSKSTFDGADISKEVGIADILNKDEQPTGYRLLQHGSNHPDGSHRFSAYFIGVISHEPASEEQLSRYVPVAQKYRDVLWGPKDTE